MAQGKLPEKGGCRVKENPPKIDDAVLRALRAWPREIPKGSCETVREAAHFPTQVFMYWLGMWGQVWWQQVVENRLMAALDTAMPLAEGQETVH